jgi:hypothetical protein
MNGRWNGIRLLRHFHFPIAAIEQIVMNIEIEPLLCPQKAVRVVIKMGTAEVNIFFSKQNEWTYSVFPFHQDETPFTSPDALLWCSKFFMLLGKITTELSSLFASADVSTVIATFRLVELGRQRRRAVTTSPKKLD